MTSREAPAQTDVLTGERGVLDREITVGQIGMAGLVSLLAVVVGAALRFADLEAYALSQREGFFAHNSWALYQGKTLPSGDAVTTLSPLFVILESIGFFLFGVTDAIARSTPALIGIGLIGLSVALRPFLGREGAASAAFLLAISPSMVFASRTVNPMIVLAFCSLLLVVVVLRAGSSDVPLTVWAAATGGALGGMIAAGPDGISAALALGVAFTVAGMSDFKMRGPISRGLGRLGGSWSGYVAFSLGLATILILAFSHVFSDPSAISGIPDTFSAWWRMVSRQTSSTPAPFFVVAALLYELLAVVFSVVAMTSRKSHPIRARTSLLTPTFAGTWFVAALILQSVSSGRNPYQMINVSLPLILLASIGLGLVWTRIDWPRTITTSVGALALVVFGIVSGALAAIAVVAGAADDQASNQIQPWMIVAFALFAVAIPVGAVILLRSRHEHIVRTVGWLLALVVAVFLAVFTVQSTISLAYQRADTGAELLAPDVPTSSVRAFVDQTLRLSRDLSLDNPSAIDNTGSFGLKIAVDPGVEYPFVWYLRDFPQLEVTSPAGWNDSDIVLAPTDSGMADAGFVIASRPLVNPGPASYDDLDVGTISPYVYSPDHWYDGFRYVFNREIGQQQVPIELSVGYTIRLSNQLNPSQGPFSLDDGLSIGPGSGLGQLNLPTGIAFAPDGETVYVVDSLNRRVVLYGRDGSFVGVWDANTDPRLELGYDLLVEQGASGITVDGAGLAYIADTWNHRVLVVDDQGKVVREFGNPGTVTNLENSPDPTGSPGLFFGPRDIAVSDNEVYVTDTGNERIQVLALDGTFLRAFGGFGTEPGKLIEPVGIAIGPDGLVYVADSGNARISVFDRQGVPLQQIPVPGWQGEAPLINFMRFGPDGLLYLTSVGTGEVEVWNGVDFGTISQSGDEDVVRSPIGIAIAPNGEVWVTSTVDTDVARFVPTFPDGYQVPSPATPAASPRTSRMTGTDRRPVSRRTGNARSRRRRGFRDRVTVL